LSKKKIYILCIRKYFTERTVLYVDQTIFSLKRSENISEDEFINLSFFMIHIIILKSDDAIRVAILPPNSVLSDLYPYKQEFQNFNSLFETDVRI